MAAPMSDPFFVRNSARGVSLVEALVALAVMSFGMLALVGVQTSMRFNSGVARQRTEATRIAATDVEKLRYFDNVVTVAGEAHPSWDALAGATVDDVGLPDGTANTSFKLERSSTLVEDRTGADGRVEAASAKVFEVKVSWVDRSTTSSSARHTAVLNSLVAAAAPALTARLSLPFVTTAPSRRTGRHNAMPPDAVDLGDGRSAYKPFDTGTTAWVIDNVTGSVTAICSDITVSAAAITSAVLTSCTTVNGRLVSGAVLFHLRRSVDAADAEAPTGPRALPLNPSTPLQFATADGFQAINQSAAPVCVADNPFSASVALGRTRIAYACVVFPADSSGWGGSLQLVAGDYASGELGNWTIGTGAVATDVRVCRYTLAGSDYTDNTDHPKTYCRVKSDTPFVTDNYCPSTRVKESLAHQNFLVIPAGLSCPTDTAVDAAAGNLVNSNTRAHQP